MTDQERDRNVAIFVRDQIEALESRVKELQNFLESMQLFRTRFTVDPCSFVAKREREAESQILVLQHEIGEWQIHQMALPNLCGRCRGLGHVNHLKCRVCFGIGLLGKNNPAMISRAVGDGK